MVRRFMWPGGVAVNISACHAEDRGFESHPGRHFPLFSYRSPYRISYRESSSASNVKPCPEAYTAASARLVAPVLLSMWPTWVLTVRMAIMSSSAISQSVLPLLIRQRTSTSRWERPPGYPEAGVSPARDIKSSTRWRRGGIPKSVEIWGLLPAAPAPGGGPRYPCAPTERQRNSSKFRHIRVCGSPGTKRQGILKMFNSLGHVANCMGQHPQQTINGDYRPFVSYL